MALYPESVARVGFALAAALFPVLVQAPLSATLAPEQGGSGDEPHELIVQFVERADAHTQSATHRAYGASVVAQGATAGGWQLVQLPPYADREELLQRYQQDPHVAHVERNRRVETAGRVSTIPTAAEAATYLPNDPKWREEEQWALQRIGMPELWGAMRAEGERAVADASGIVIAVLDTGAELEHEDLIDNIWRGPDGRQGFDLIDGGYAPYDRSKKRHGTMVAGIAAARGDNERGMAGVSWHVELLPVRFMREDQGSVADAIRGIEHAQQSGAQVINASYASRVRLQSEHLPTRCDDFADGRLECRAVQEAGEQGIVVVAAAGNSGADNDFAQRMTVPAALPLPNVIAVAASTRSESEDGRAADRLTDFSNYGHRTTHLAAPGSAVLGTQYVDYHPSGRQTHHYGLLEGTSASAPQVSGLVALLMAREIQAEAALETTPTVALAVRERILGTVACDEQSAERIGHACLGGALGSEEAGQELAAKTLAGGRLDAAAAWLRDREEIPPVAPSHVSARQQEDEGIELRWLSSSPRADHYLIERWSSERDDFEEVVRYTGESGLMEPGAQRFVDGSAEPSAAGLYRIRAVSASGLTSRWLVASVYAPPDGLQARPVGDGVELTWPAVEELAGAQEPCLELWREGRAEGEKAEDGESEQRWRLSIDEASYTDRAVAPGRYAYRLRACGDCRSGDLSGCSPWSEAAEAVVGLAPAGHLARELRPLEEAETDIRCWIASAAYGSPNAQELERLRAFRDERLMARPLGYALVGLYYRFSPPLAHWIAADAQRQAVARSLFERLVPVLERLFPTSSAAGNECGRSSPEVLDSPACRP
ncbi:hypothetical protein CKO15_02620 [Halorhodospira abdelmalekii]|uniref:S8 family serine peptidase n=1 Tax=Halorhodospira abdelmalekii TaxID=421629 RepID=UPI001904092D|nr:S8 family serine peptidase [Halorhodospira abdelmalekii]MBK1734193.1 hypothetical protein [Halorhodospira abdelmalekii]